MASRGDWHSFEPLLARYLDVVLALSVEATAATKVMRHLSNRPQQPGGSALADLST